MSSGKAAEPAGTPKPLFFVKLVEVGVSASTLTAADIAEEITNAQEGCHRYITHSASLSDWPIFRLPRLYTEAIIPPAVERELAAGRSIGVVLPDLNTLPELHEHIPSLLRPLALATTLGDGEREALALALETPNIETLNSPGRLGLTSAFSGARQASFV